MKLPSQLALSIPPISNLFNSKPQRDIPNQHLDLEMDSHAHAGGPKYECLLFDMDDTLYPLSSGVNLACRKNIEAYMLQYLHIEESEVPRMCLELYREYGTTMAGLKALGFEFDNDEFHAYVHGRLPYDVLKADIVLRNLLSSLPQRKIIFTNADRTHATQVLNRLGVEDCFEGIICFETLNPPCESSLEATTDTGIVPTSNSKILCKPSLEAIQAAIQIANVDPKKTIFFDDSARNIAIGKAAGLETVIVGRSEMVDGADHALRSIHNLKEALPQLWDTEAKAEGHSEEERTLVEPLIHSVAVETVVHA